MARSTVAILVCVIATAAFAAPDTKPSTKPTSKPTTRRTRAVVARPMPPAPLAAKPRSAPVGPELWELIAQRRDPELRRTSLQKMHAMLSGNSVADQRVALRTLQQIAEIKFDRSAFAGLIRALLESPDDEVRGAALQALPAYPMSQDDLEPIAAMASDRSARVRAGVANALVVANGRVGSPELDTAMLTLLDDADLNVSRESIRATANIDLSEAVENKLIALTDDPKLSREAINQGISTRPVIDGAIARRLIDLLDDADPQSVSRAAWALRNAALEGADRAELDAALLRTLDDSLNVAIRESCVNALARSPDPAVYERLGQIALDPQEPDRVRDAAIRSQR